MTRRTAMLLFPGFTALDAIGPYHALAALPGHEFLFVAERAGSISDGAKVTLQVQHSIDDVDHVDLLVVPGGLPAVGMARTGHPLVEWIRRVHPTTTWTTSVCTGALMLGAAGVLEGRAATTHWFCRDELALYGAVPTDQRVVRDGKVVTAAGVSAGIDMALVLTELIAGTDYAHAIQLDMEYDPEPPLDGGHPSKTPHAITDQVRSMYQAMLDAM